MTFTEVLPVAPLPGSTYIDRITATLPFLTMIDLIYAHFLEMDRERKERIFNSYWENKNSMATIHVDASLLIYHQELRILFSATWFFFQ